jgi:hypothetical protein
MLTPYTSQLDQEMVGSGISRVSGPAGMLLSPSTADGGLIAMHGQHTRRSPAQASGSAPAAAVSWRSTSACSSMSTETSAAR